MSKYIHVTIVIDTKYIKNKYEGNDDPDNPKGIDHGSQYMLVNSEHVVDGQGTADLNFKAESGDLVLFHGTSMQANSEDAVIVYGIEHWYGANVFNDFRYSTININEAVMPSVGGNGLPPEWTAINFLSYDARVIKEGKEHFKVKIAVYERSGDKQVIYGHYLWDPTITVG